MSSVRGVHSNSAGMRLGAVVVVLAAVACGGDDVVRVSTPPTITSDELAPGTVGVAYTAALTATGGQPPYSWAVSSGDLPDGLALAASTGSVSGTPIAAGTAQFTVAVTGADGSRSTKEMSLTVAASLGAALIAVRVSGNARDPDGYSVTAAGTVYDLAAGDTLRIDQLQPGTLAVVLGGLAPHCATEEDSVSVQIGGNDAPAEVWFDVECYADLVYTEPLGPAHDALYYLDAQGRARRLTEPMEGGQWNPRWSPDGTHVAFMKLQRSGSSAGEKDLYVADLQGNSWAIADRAGRTEWGEAWSPDGEWIVYSLLNGVNVFTRAELRLVRPDGTGDHAILEGGGRVDTQPTWSPDGQWIAFACGGASFAICFVRPDGTELSKAPVEVSAPQKLAWSPAGDLLAYEDFSLGYQSIVVMRLTDWETRPVLEGTLTVGPPSWAPDGRRLLVGTWADGKFSAVVADPFKGEVTTVASPTRWWGSWSPDGARVSFSGISDAIEISDPQGHKRRSIWTGGAPANAYWRPANVAAGTSLVPPIAAIPVRDMSALGAAVEWRCHNKEDPWRQEIVYECTPGALR